MDSKIWAVSQDGSIRFQQLTSEYLDDAVDMMDDAFYRSENICKALGICEDPKAIEEVKELTREAATYGVTVIAIDVRKNKVVGAAFNRLPVKPTTDGKNPFDIFAKTWKQPRSHAVLKFMDEIENMYDIFEHCQVDCLLEIMFLGTLPEYRGKGIAKKLCEISLEIGKKLLDGVNVKVPIDGRKLDLEPVPKVAFAIFSSFITQRIGKQLGFTAPITRSFELFEFNGRTFASVIGEHTPNVTLEYKRLK